MTLHIRPLMQADKPNWSALWRSYLEHYETTLPPEIYDTTFARMLGDDPQDFCGFIAELDGKPLGLVHFLFHRHGWKVENVCYLQDLYVVAENRGTGAGRALIEAVYNEADRQGAPEVYWLTQDFNTHARKLYDRVGRCTPFIKYNRL